MGNWIQLTSYLIIPFPRFRYKQLLMCLQHFFPSIFIVVLLLRNTNQDPVEICQKLSSYVKNNLYKLHE